jgi:zinc protease
MAALAAAQPPPAAPAQTPQAAPANRPAARPAAGVPAVKDLKFPPLHPIEIPAVETFTLPNGMNVFLLEDHELPLVHGAARIRTGNLFDPPDKIGLAAMTGMVMRTGGTRQKTGDELDLELEDVAASVETGIDETYGSASFSALAENTDEVMGIFHDVLTSPAFRQDKIDLAKTQMGSTISRRNDNAHGIAQREFADTLYGKDTPYGWEEQYATVGRISRADLESFYQRYFFPANVLLAVWGDFKTAEMKARLEKMFADWTVAQQPVPPFPKVTGKPAPGIFLAVKKDVDQTFFSMGQWGGEFRDPDYAALEIMADILGGGFQSRLFQRVRTKMGNAYQIGANWGASYDHPGLFEISGSTKSVSTVEVTEDELKSAKDTALNSLVFAFDTKSKTIVRMLNYAYYGYPRDFIQQYQKALGAVTRADVLRVAKARLNPAEFTVVAAGDPDQFSQPLTALGAVVPIDLTIPEPPPAEAGVRNQTGAASGKGLLERAQQAAGGADKLAAAHDFVETASFRLDASVPNAGGIEIHETERWVSATHLRQDNVMPMGTVSDYCDGKTGWISTPQGVQALAGAQLKQVEGDVFRLYFRMLLSDRIEGRVVNGVDRNTVEIREGDNRARVAFDPATGLPQKVTYDSVAITGPPEPVEEDFSDFRDVSGVKVPFRVEIFESGKKFAVLTVEDYKINTGLKPEDLSKRP